MVAKSLSGVRVGGGGSEKAEGDNGGSAVSRQQPEGGSGGSGGIGNGLNGSAGCDGATNYLFKRSTDGLLDLDLTRAHSYYCSPPAQTSAATSDNNTSSTHCHRSASVEKRFSLESNSSGDGEESFNDNRKHQQQQQHQSYNFTNHYQSWQQFRKSTERRAAGLARSLAKSLEMAATKRYYFLLLAFSLVIITCLLVSIVISRSVGLEPDELVDQSGASSRAALTANAPLLVGQPPIIEYEQRSIDVVDLVECGKTFAYTKVNIQVRVPKSSPIYRQQPSFMHHIKPASESKQTTDPVQESSPTISTSAEQSDKEIKFILINPDDFINGDEVSITTSATSVDVNPKNLSPATSAEPPSSTPTSDNGSASREIPGAETAATEDASSAESDRDQLMAASELLNGDRENSDPFVALASELNQTPSSLNRTMIDCFLVDTDKRYNQRMMLEDRHRGSASTRKVGVKKMIEIIIECRKLTWASLPSKISIKSLPMSGRSLEVSASNEHSSNPLDGELILPPGNPQPNMIASLFEDWFRATREPLSPASEDRLISNGSSRRTTRQVTALPPRVEDDPRAKAQADQSSYLNMGLSMMSGIVPNTLWCGLGDRASNYSELGVEYRVDSCCRAHDHCPIRMKPFTADYGLVNWSMSTRSHCDCDFDFDDCLKLANTTLSNVIRNLYFRFVGLQCIDVEGRRLLNKAEI